jgi:hypothetical protein
VTIQIELKFQLNFEFSIFRKEITNYSRIHVSLYRLLHIYCYMVRRSVTCFTSANLHTCSVTIRELCKPAYKIIRLEAAVVNVIL